MVSRSSVRCVHGDVYRLAIWAHLSCIRWIMMVSSSMSGLICVSVKFSMNVISCLMNVMRPQPLI